MLKFGFQIYDTKEKTGKTARRLECLLLHAEIKSRNRNCRGILFWISDLY